MTEWDDAAAPQGRAPSCVFLPADRRGRRSTVPEVRPLSLRVRVRLDRRHGTGGTARRPMDAGGRDAERRGRLLDGGPPHPGTGAAGAAGWRGRAERWLGMQPHWSRWWVDGVTRIGSGLDDVDVIVATMSPYESAYAARRLSAELGRPWVADLRDPWALDEMTVFPSALHRRARAAAHAPAARRRRRPSS